MSESFHCLGRFVPQLSNPCLEQRDLIRHMNQDCQNGAGFAARQILGAHGFQMNQRLFQLTEGIP